MTPESRESGVQSPEPGLQPAAHGPQLSCEWSRRRLRRGWWSLLFFLSMGLLLEALLGFKVSWYVNAGDMQMRRELWRLAHAHGTLISLVQIAFALSVAIFALPDSRLRVAASSCLYAATVALPGGFFLGGLYVYSGDPGVGIFLAPVGGLFLFLAVLLTARMIGARTGAAVENRPSPQN